MQKKALIIASAVFVFSAFVLKAELEESYWIGGANGSTDDPADWSSAVPQTYAKNNQIGVFTNSATVSIPSTHAGFSHLRVRNGAEVVITASSTDYRLGLNGESFAEGYKSYIDVAQGSSLTIGGRVQGMYNYFGRKNTLIKNGPGVLTAKSTIDDFDEIDVTEGTVVFDNSKDATGGCKTSTGVHVGKYLMTIRNGAKVEQVKSNPFHNMLNIRVEKGGLFNAKGLSDVIAAFTGDGIVSNGTFMVKLKNGPYTFSGKAMRMELTIYKGGDDTSAQTEEERGYIIGAADAFSASDMKLKMSEGFAAPENPVNSCIRFAPGIGTFTINDLTGTASHPIYLADTTGNVVTMRVHKATGVSVCGPVDSSARGCLMFDRNQTFNAVLGPGADLAATAGATVTLGASAEIDPGAVFRFEKGTTLDLGGKTVTVRRFTGGGRKTNGRLVQTDPVGMTIIVR